MAKDNFKTPLHEIKDGNYFQQIVAAYFRNLGNEKQDFHIADVEVNDSGIGCDNGCDILVDFHFKDAIGKHNHRWVVECKSQNRSVGNRDININNLYGILKSKKANGYLLVCKSNASSQLKRLLEENEEIHSVIWSGTELWQKFTDAKKIIESFFPDYYYKYFIENKSIEKFDTAFEKFENQIKQ